MRGYVRGDGGSYDVVEVLGIRESVTFDEESGTVIRRLKYLVQGKDFIYPAEDIYIIPESNQCECNS